MMNVLIHQAALQEYKWTEITSYEPNPEHKFLTIPANRVNSHANVQPRDSDPCAERGFSAAFPVVLFVVRSVATTAPSRRLLQFSIQENKLLRILAQAWRSGRSCRWKKNKNSVGF